jgi:hypothetical protein
MAAVEAIQPPHYARAHAPSPVAARSPARTPNSPLARRGTPLSRTASPATASSPSRTGSPTVRLPPVGAAVVAAEEQLREMLVGDRHAARKMLRAPAPLWPRAHALDSALLQPAPLRSPVISPVTRGGLFQ